MCSRCAPRSQSGIVSRAPAPSPLTPAFCYPLTSCFLLHTSYPPPFFASKGQLRAYHLNFNGRVTQVSLPRLHPLFSLYLHRTSRFPLTSLFTFTLHLPPRLLFQDSVKNFQLVMASPALGAPVERGAVCMQVRDRNLLHISFTSPLHLLYISVHLLCTSLAHV